MVANDRSTGSCLELASVPTPLVHRYLLMVRTVTSSKMRRSILIPGLTAQQAMGCVVVGAMITGILSVLSGTLHAFFDERTKLSIRSTWRDPPCWIRHHKSNELGNVRSLHCKSFVVYIHTRSKLIISPSPYPASPRYFGSESRQSGEDRR